MGTVVNETLPEATGGDGTLVYTITRALPDGLTFNAAATPPTITGTPTTAASSVTYRYNVDDSDANDGGRRRLFALFPNHDTGGTGNRHHHDH